MECIILSVKELYMDAQEVMYMTDYSKITALYSRLSVGDEDRDGGESNSIQNQKKSWRSMLLNTDIPTSNSMLMMAFPVRPLTALAFNR